MGWFWNSSSSSPPSTEGTVSSTIPDLATAASTKQQNTAHIPPPSSAPSSAQQADRELEDFLASLESNSRPGPAYSRIKPNPTTASNNGSASASTDPGSISTTNPAPSETPTHFAPTGTTDPSGGATVDLDTLDISPDALYPRTMSCRQAFDEAFYCQSLGGKFNDLYRHGGIRSCSEQWGAFWFCMRIKNLGDEDKGQAVAEWYKARDERVRKERGGSSEDIWEIRTEPVKKAFWRDPDEVAQTWKGEGQKGQKA
ncbi:hypothetical protein AAFC00_005197 [Neodothiora populina]|uniref:Early meiotic induction protein 1 n=1 Tax=Neodothiora populina TaxID=2781224 RepID=A0ABR3PKB7_9PEZI